MLTTQSTRLVCKISVFIVMVAGLTVSVALACQVPVFRYALERWSADKFEVVILHDSPFSGCGVEFTGCLGYIVEFPGNACEPKNQYSRCAYHHANVDSRHCGSHTERLESR